MSSYNGKIQPRPHDNQLTYVGGETKILAVDRSIKFNAIKSKLSLICNDADLCFKYQLVGEDLDALTFVTNDEDLEHIKFNAIKSESGLRVESIGGSLWVSRWSLEASFPLKIEDGGSLWVGVTVELGSSISFKDWRWWKSVDRCHDGAWKLCFLQGSEMVARRGSILLIVFSSSRQENSRIQKRRLGHGGSPIPNGSRFAFASCFLCRLFRTQKLEQGNAAHEVHCSRERSRAAQKIIEEYLMPFVEKERYQMSIRTLKLEQGNAAYEVHCSRERSRAAQKIIEEYLMPFVEKERYQMSVRCRLHSDNDLYRDQEQHKIRVDNHSRCLADVYGALHCDLVMDSTPRKTKCNPAAVSRN
nr:hypothetical protein CFP56_63668 [Quercus suber]